MWCFDSYSCKTLVGRALGTRETLHGFRVSLIKSLCNKDLREYVEVLNYKLIQV